jgi:hypothetical protein
MPLHDVATRLRGVGNDCLTLQILVKKPDNQEAGAA